MKNSFDKHDYMECNTAQKPCEKAKRYCIRLQEAIISSLKENPVIFSMLKAIHDMGMPLSANTFREMRKENPEFDVRCNLAQNIGNGKFHDIASGMAMEDPNMMKWYLPRIDKTFIDGAKLADLEMKRKEIETKIAEADSMTDKERVLELMRKIQFSNPNLAQVLAEQAELMVDDDDELAAS